MEKDNELNEEVAVVDSTEIDESKETETPADNDDAIDWKSEAEKWKTLSKKNEALSKANFSKLSEKEVEIKALAEKAQQADTISKTFNQTLKKLVAVENGLPAELAARLSGSTEEEIRKDAESLAALFASGSKQLPKPVGFQGQDGTTPTEPVFKTRQEYTNYYKNR